MRAEGTKLWRFGEPYRFVGANLWQAMHLGADADAGGDRAQLVRELDRLQALGVANLRVMAASEGPDESDESVGAGLVDLALSVGSATPWRVLPAMQPSPGLYNDGVVAGLDFLLVELARRDMTAVLVLGNTWPFTGGFAQYVAWATGKEIPYPPPAEGGNWDAFQQFVKDFFGSAARALHAAHVRYVVGRTNAISGVAYADDPTIMAWELANEPRPMRGAAAFREWIGATAALVRALAPRQLVALGSEGTTPLPQSYVGIDPRAEHAAGNLSYLAIHLWPGNWGWLEGAPDAAAGGGAGATNRTARETVAPALKKAAAYVEHHLAIAADLGMPLVVEAFGAPRRRRGDALRRRRDDRRARPLRRRRVRDGDAAPRARRDRRRRAVELGRRGAAARRRRARVEGGRSADRPAARAAGVHRRLPQRHADAARRVPRGGAPLVGARVLAPLPVEGAESRAAARAAAEAGSGDDTGSAARDESLPAATERWLELGGADRGAVQLALAAQRATGGEEAESPRGPSYTSYDESEGDDDEAAGSPFVRAEGTKLWRFGEPYRFVGANLWQAMHLGAEAAAGGDGARLVRELDRLQALGVANLRVMAASEGPDREPWNPHVPTPWRVVPAMQPAPCVYNRAVIAGLDFLLVELARRDMTAVLVLGNMWPWSRRLCAVRLVGDGPAGAAAGARAAPSRRRGTSSLPKPSSTRRMR